MPDGEGGTCGARGEQGGRQAGELLVPSMSWTSSAPTVTPAASPAPLNI
ncbi:hypothetical protein [Streptomyces sp. NPDC057438]